MSYDYTKQREVVFTESGLIMLFKIRDKARALLETAGAFREQGIHMGCSGDSWDMLACVDYLVERGEIRRVVGGNNVARQHNIYTTNSI
jgi:hypothetical protein